MPLCATIHKRIKNHNMHEHVEYKDIYLTLLRFVNAGMLFDGNILSMNIAIKELHPNTAIVEIGSFCGLSANIRNFFKKACDKSNPFFCVHGILRGPKRRMLQSGQARLSPMRNIKTTSGNLLKEILLCFPGMTNPTPLKLNRILFLPSGIAIPPLQIFFQEMSYWADL